MPFWTLFWLIAPAVALLAIGTWISVGRDTPDQDTATHEARNRTDR